MKKGRASSVTRPEPTIYGNCDSWNSIVGKKGSDLGPNRRQIPALHLDNEKFFTGYQQVIPDTCSFRRIEQQDSFSAAEKA
ncbi:hypothetical protein FVQ98_01865 [Ottowia sp. GY511]|uniref:Uncharacterized protein n=2 Tax=Ottowia TaxID=219181 RepID=A0ABW4KSM7_9BURK|nr:hypothetical protein FVQ98_01865 [Ottowia sp. GY511]